VRIGWFTPFSRRSAIAEVSQHVTAELAGRVDVEIWGTGCDEPCRTDLPLHDLDERLPTPEELDRYDWCVYHYGDHAPFHARIHEVAVQRPGIVVLHDRVLQNLFSGMWIARDRDPARYVERMGAWYGEDGRRAASDAMVGRGRRPWDNVEDYLRFPLWHEAMIGALGVLTHSASHADDVRTGWGGPVRSVSLPTYPGDWAERPAATPAPDDRTRLLTVGYVNPNKRVLEVVRALARDPAVSARIHYTIAGSYADDSPYVQELRAEIDKAGLQDTVELTGWCDDERLEQLMADADVFINLRWPTLEGGSASLVRQLPWAKPVIAFASGAFGELAPGAVATVPPNDYDGLVADLGVLIGDPALRARIGAAGREAARSMTVAAYVDTLLALIEEADHWAPMTAFCDRIADELALLGVDSRLPAVDVVADQVARMFPDRER
jgi:glycosyltransferase involved in cell wall biosynthesis